MKYISYFSKALGEVSEDIFSEGSAAFRPGEVQEPERTWQGTGGTAFAQASFLERNENRISGEWLEYGGESPLR